MIQLRLRIISEQRRLLGERSVIAFGAQGGTIGRSADNDWILPDPQRYISAHHARISFHEGHFIVEDTSTNGVFVNDDERPLRELGPYRVRSGDILRLGEYQVVAAVENHAAEPAIANAPTHIDVLRIFGRPTQTDIGAALDLDALLSTESPSGSRLRPVNAYGQAVAAHEAAPAPAVPDRTPGAPAAASEVDADEAVARRIERLARAAARTRDARGAGTPAPVDAHNGMQAFCRGAGIDTARLPADAQMQLLHLVGQLLREALVGYKDLERAREESRARFHIDLPSDPEDPRPSLVRSTIEELLVEILAQHESRRLDAVQWLREAIQAARMHEQASAEALRAAFVEFVGRFDPAELEARFERTLRRGGKPSGDSEPRYWQLFAEFYRNLAEMPADRMPPTFSEAFATAYKRALEARAETQ